MFRTTIAGLVGAALVLSASCSKKDEAPVVEVAPKVELVSKAELDGLERRLMAEVEKNRSKKCLRPLLRGEPLPGRADEDVLALLAPTDPALLECLKKVEAYNEKINDYLAQPATEPPDYVREVLASCATLPGFVSRAVGHEDACSPFLAGRRGLTRLIHLIRYGKAVAVLAIDSARKGDHQTAFHMTVDLLRLVQDLSRGGAPLITAMVGVAAVSSLAQGGLRTILNAPGVPPADAMTALAAELTALIGTEPPFGSFFAYERYGLSLQMVLPRIKGKGWVPPGGYDDDFDPDAGLKELGESMEGLDPAQEMGLVWIASEHTMDALEKACPTNAAPAVCFRGLRATARQKADQAVEGQWGRSLKVMLEKDPGPEIRKWIIDILQGVGAPAFSKYVPRYSMRDFYIRTLRLHSAIVAARQQTGRCPTVEELQQGKWLELTVDGSGGRLRISSPTGDKLIVAPADNFEGSEDDWHRDAEYVILCRRP